MPRRVSENWAKALRNADISLASNVPVGPFSFLQEEQVTLMLRNKTTVQLTSDFDTDRAWRDSVGAGLGHVSLLHTFLS